MNWKYLNTGFNSGQFNMDFDLFLVKNILPGEKILRIYRWKPHCISLGFNQSEKSLNLPKLKNDNIDYVKRPTGGRAILHSEELTYSVIYSLNSEQTVKELYREINLALKDGLSFYDNRLKQIELEHRQPDFSSLYKQEKGLICFAAAAKDEINFSDKKLIGSAQRKIGNVLLQHGSILCGENHKKIVDYLNLKNESLEKIENEIDKTTISLQEILDTPVDYERLTVSIVKGFEKHFKMNFEKLPPDFLQTEILTAEL